MPIAAAYMVPHPPMIVPEVGRGSEKQIEKTIAAYRAVAAEIAEIRPETIIVTSPHTVLYADYFHISPGEHASGDFGSFRAPGVKFRKRKPAIHLQTSIWILQRNRFTRNLLSRIISG